MVEVEVDGAFAFGESEFAELIVDLGVDGDARFKFFAGEGDEFGGGIDGVGVGGLDAADPDLPVVVMAGLVFEKVDEAFGLLELDLPLCYILDVGETVAAVTGCQEAAGHIELVPILFGEEVCPVDGRQLLIEIAPVRVGSSQVPEDRVGDGPVVAQQQDGRIEAQGGVLAGQHFVKEPGNIGVLVIERSKQDAVVTEVVTVGVIRVVIGAVVVGIVFLFL